MRTIALDYDGTYTADPELWDACIAIAKSKLDQDRAGARTWITEQLKIDPLFTVLLQRMLQSPPERFPALLAVAPPSLTKVFQNLAVISLVEVSFDAYELLTDQVVEGDDPDSEG